MNLRLIPVVLTLVAVAAAAPPFNGGYGCFGPTVGMVNFSGLDSAFSAGGIPQKLSSTHWGFGGAGFALIDRVVIGGSGWGGSQSVGSNDLRATVEISGGEFDFGYQLLWLRHLLVAPILGIGGSEYTIELQKLAGMPPNFDSLLRNPGYASTVSFSGLTLSPQLIVTIPIAFAGFQLRGGYNYIPVNPQWQLEGGSKLAQGPAIAKGMPFVTLNVVIGGFEAGKHRGRK